MLNFHFVGVDMATEKPAKKTLETNHHLVGCSDSEPGSGSTEVAGYPWEILTYAGMHVY